MAHQILNLEINVLQVDSRVRNSVLPATSAGTALIDSSRLTRGRTALERNGGTPVIRLVDGLVPLDYLLRDLLVRGRGVVSLVQHLKVHWIGSQLLQAQILEVVRVVTRLLQRHLLVNTVVDGSTRRSDELDGVTIRLYGALVTRVP